VSQFHPSSQPPSPNVPGCEPQVERACEMKVKEGWAAEPELSLAAEPDATSAQNQTSSEVIAQPDSDSQVESVPMNNNSSENQTQLINDAPPSPLIKTDSEPIDAPMEDCAPGSIPSPTQTVPTAPLPLVAEPMVAEPVAIPPASPEPLAAPSVEEKITAPVPAEPSPVAEKPISPLSSPTPLPPIASGPKYAASIPLPDGNFLPVGSSAPVTESVDFEAEKAKIEAEFTKLEEQLDAGTHDRAEIEKEFDLLTKKADALRRQESQTAKPLQVAESVATTASAPVATPVAAPLPPLAASASKPMSLQPLQPLQPLQGAGRTAQRDPSKPTMAIVHWPKVTKDQYKEYREKLIAKYGSGPDMIKSTERIPNRIIITAPISEVMERILADEELDPRPEPYKLPTKGGSNAKLAPLKPLQPVQAPSSLPPVQPSVALQPSA